MKSQKQKLSLMKKRRNNLINDISIYIENHNNEFDSDEEVEDFFNNSI